nr:glycerol kinase GlpK [Maliibacterium massiliense]
MAKYILALDQGTTSSRAIVFDASGGMVSAAQHEFTQHYPRNGWVEHDPMDIWNTQLQAIREAVARAAISAGEIAAVGITNQRETTLVWDRASGAPIYNAIVWQCRRTAAQCDALRAQGNAEMIRQKTGLVVDAYFSGTKLAWILDHVPGARARAEAGELCFGTVDSWLVYQLTNKRVHVTDVTNASRTMLYNIHTRMWDEELLRLLDIPRTVLPEVKPSVGVVGMMDAAILGSEIPIAGIAGDQHAALFGQTCFSPGDAKNTYGTGCFLLMNTGSEAVASRHGLLTTIAWGIGDRVEYALEGSIFVTGAAIQWLRDEMQLIENAAQSEALAWSVDDTGGVVFVPAFTGMGAPYWDAYSRGTILGLTRGTTRAHIVRAALESIALETRDVLVAMQKDAGVSLSRLLVDGGASANNFLMQFQADILEAQVMRPQNIETTAMGAAYMAGLATGVWRDKAEIARMHAIDGVFSAQRDAAWVRRKCALWERAVSRARNWLQPDAGAE